MSTLGEKIDATMSVILPSVLIRIRLLRLVMFFVCYMKETLRNALDP